MLNQFLTDTWWYLHDYCLFNWSFTNAKLILMDSLNQINIYKYLTVTCHNLGYAYIFKATFKWSWPIFKWWLQACNSMTDFAWIDNGIKIKLENDL